MLRNVFIGGEFSHQWVNFPFTRWGLESKKKCEWDIDNNCG